MPAEAPPVLGRLRSLVARRSRRQVEFRANQAGIGWRGFVRRSTRGLVSTTKAIPLATRHRSRGGGALLAPQG